MKKADPTVPAQPQPVNKELEEVRLEGQEWKNKYLRALADYQNLERRVREEKDEVRQYAAEVMLGRLLPVVDTFRKVHEHVKDAGLALAFKELMAVLDSQGVEKIEAVGKEFDPHTMECIEVVDGHDNIVIEETLPGYLFRGKTLRVAQVKVGKNNKDLPA